MKRTELPVHGRGASGNPANRFESIAYEAIDDDTPDDDRPGPRTLFYKDMSRSLITTNESPDIAFEASINPYRGCEHGCIYCYARPYHEYLGLSAGLDFETKIFVKEDAPEILRRELQAKSWQPKWLSLSGVTDPYQPIERRATVTRRCLQVLAEFRNPVGVITKNHLVTRDADVLADLAQFQAAGVTLAITTLEPELAQTMEPRASAPHARLAAIRELHKAGIPVAVLIAPTIPGLNDHEIPAILTAAREAGARHAGYVMLRLPHGIKDLFSDWLTQHYPERKDKILGRVRELRGGNLNDPRFRSRMKGEGPMAELIGQVFKTTARRLGFVQRSELSTANFRRLNETPASLFDGL